jgi:hypothetical protein
MHFENYIINIYQIKTTFFVGLHEINICLIHSCDKFYVKVGIRNGFVSNTVHTIHLAIKLSLHVPFFWQG